MSEAPEPPTEPVRPTVSVAHPRGRHWLLLGSFLLIVVLPAALWAWYLWARASDQYVSTVGFSVRKEDMTPSIDLLGGFMPLAGGSGASDTDILYEYIRSQEIVAAIAIDEVVAVAAGQRVVARPSRQGVRQIVSA